MNRVSLRGEHRLLTKARILGAARLLFVETGYAATRMDEIAREADLSRTTLYQHFSSKTAIMEAILEDEIPRFAHLLDGLQGVALDRTLIELLLERMARHYQENSDFVAILRQAIVTEPTVAAQIEQSYRGVIRVLRDHLPAREDGPDDMTIQTRLYICLSAANSMFERCLHAEWADDRDKVRTELVSLWCSMFRL